MTDPQRTNIFNTKALGLQKVFGRIGFIWVLLLLTIAVGAFSSPVFLTVNNLFNILIASAALGCLVLAQAPVLLLGKFDLSTEANMIFVAILGTLVMTQPVATSMGSGIFQGGGLGLAWPLGIATMVVVAAFIGLLNGSTSSTANWAAGLCIL